VVLSTVIIKNKSFEKNTLEYDFNIENMQSPKLYFQLRIFNKIMFWNTIYRIP